MFELCLCIFENIHMCKIYNVFNFCVFKEEHAEIVLFFFHSWGNEILIIKQIRMTWSLHDADYF